MHSYQGHDYEVIVVGSGAGGGMAAHTLTSRGVRVLMLEAGRDYDPVTETPMFNTNDQAPLRGAKYGVRWYLCSGTQPPFSFLLKIDQADKTYI